LKATGTQDFLTSASKGSGLRYRLPIFVPSKDGNAFIEMRFQVFGLKRHLKAQEVLMLRKASKRSFISYTASAGEHSAAQKTCDWREQVELPKQPRRGERHGHARVQSQAQLSASRIAKKLNL
jgi:hypothetical protein